MSSDLELLELAAKSAGAEWSDYSDRTPDHWKIKHSDGVCRRWEPLLNDGDALRLAIDLNISLNPSISGVKEKHSWARKKIVEAAADIGESMP